LEIAELGRRLVEGARKSLRDLRAMEYIIQSSGQEGRVLSWEGLAIEAGI